MLMMLSMCVAQEEDEFVNIGGPPGWTRVYAPHVDAFYEETGIRVNLITVDQVVFDITGYEGEVFRDYLDGSPNFDGMILKPDWLPELVGCEACPGYPNVVEPLSEYVRRDISLEWLDVLPYMRKLNSVYNGELYGVPLDGDALSVYYRVDVLEANGVAIPRTWPELFAASRQLEALPDDQRDWNGDGVPDYGFCMPAHEQMLFNLLVTLMQSDGPEQAALFDPDTMEPQLRNEAYARAIEWMAESQLSGGPQRPDGWPENDGTWATDDAIRTLQVLSGFDWNGRCAFYMHWPNWLNVVSGINSANVTSMLPLMPGSSHVLDHDSGQLRDCNDDPSQWCPRATHYEDTDTYVNHAQYMPSSWSGVVSAQVPERRRLAAYRFFAFLSSPEVSMFDVTLWRNSNVNPFRLGHFSLSAWRERGHSAEHLDGMLAGFRAHLHGDNQVPSLKMFRSTDIKRALAVQPTVDYLSGMPMSEIIDRAYATVTALLEEAGTKKQLQIYRSSLGLPPKNFDSQRYVNEAARISMIVLAALCIVATLLVAFYVFVHRRERVFHYASPSFLICSLFGAVVAFSAAFPFSLKEPSNGSCTSTMWLLAVGLSLLLGSLFAKTYRVFRLFNNRSLVSIRLRDVDLLPIVLTIVGVAVALAAAWTGVDAPTDTLTKDGVDSDEFIMVCDATDHGLAFFLAVVAYFGVLLIVAVLLSFMTRDVTTAFSESRALALSSYNLSLCLIVFVTAALAISAPDARYVLACIAVLFGVSVTVGLLFAPKIYKSTRGRGDDVAVTRLESIERLRKKASMMASDLRSSMQNDTMSNTMLSSCLSSNLGSEDMHELYIDQQEIVNGSVTVPLPCACDGSLRITVQ
jgi:multiple sugar transport system substrate-binding protein